MTKPEDGSLPYNQQYSDVALPQHDWAIDRQRLIAIIREELTLSKEDRVLDIGADDGFFLQTLAPDVGEIHGVDVNKDAVLKARDPRLHVMDTCHMSFSDGAFTKIYSSHTIEHLPNVGDLFSEIARVLKPGGQVLFIYPWELFRGMAAIRSSLHITGNPFRAREFHLQRLTPKKLRTQWQMFPFREIKSRLIFARTPQWITHLARTEG